MKKTMQKTAFILLAMILCNTAWANDNWIYIGETSLFKYSVSPKRIQHREGKHLDVWIKGELIIDNANIIVNQHTLKKWDYTNILMDVDCQSRKMHSQHIILYRADNSLITSEDFSKVEQPATPGTPGWDIVNYACKRYHW